MRTWFAMAGCVASLVLGGCGSGNRPGQPGAESSVVGQSADDQNGSGPDSPVAGDDQGAADLPSLPIGGNASFDPGTTTTCAFVAWNGGTLPDGVVVRIAGLTSPAGIGLDTSASCEGPPCLNADSFRPDQQTCTVGLAWDGTTPADAEPTISASGTVRCESQHVCDQLKVDAEAAGGVMSVQLPEPAEPSTATTESTDTTDDSS